MHDPAFFLLLRRLHYPGCPRTLTPLQTQVLVSSFAGVQLLSIRDLYCLIHSYDSENKPRSASKIDFLLEFWTEKFEPHAFLFSLQHGEPRGIFWGPGLSVVGPLTILETHPDELGTLFSNVPRESHVLKGIKCELCQKLRGLVLFLLLLLLKAFNLLCKTS